MHEKNKYKYCRNTVKCVICSSYNTLNTNSFNVSSKMIEYFFHNVV